tara:strand:- start:74 stop:310 length:237 start_codon:yes stop_codon:yes gene_type:complete
MKVFIISVVMWWADPALMPSTDAVEVHTLHGKPLFFKTRAACFEHIDQNLEALKKFGKRFYPTANAVREIYCLERERS